MRTFAILCAASALGFIGEPSKEQGERIVVLIKQLGDDKFARREAASKELEGLGETALPALRKAAASEDLEVRRRTEKLIALIRDRLDRTDVKSVPPPKGAIVLFDGKKLDGWVGRDGETAPGWKLLDGGAMEARGGDIRTRQTFAGGYRLHVEFQVPNIAGTMDAQRGNSGVFLHGRYEVQIFDSHGLATDVKSCGAIYGFAAPRVNASRVPGVWQCYDIDFRPPRFEEGNKVESARLTVFHNGVLLHDKVEVATEDTGCGLKDDPAQPGPILLQDHGSPVRFRNLWLLPLARR